MAAAASVLALPGTSGQAWAGSGTAPYIVADLNGVDSSLALNDVVGVGGTVVEPLNAADAVLAQLTSAQVTALQLLTDVVVTPDVAVSVQAAVSTGTHPPSAVFPEQTAATKLWQKGDTGSGVDVAVLDTGIDPLPDFAGRLVGGVDLSGEGNPLYDGYGHGTFVAGLIAGNGASSNGTYMGEAPGAGLVAVKVAGASGQTDLATVIAGVGWTIDNRAAFHIGVLNMSLGYQPLESTAIDPLDTAVEKAWLSDIAVVASAGNAGPFDGTILSPGDDPLVVTVGALDDMAQRNVSKDTMTRFSSAGPTNPDGWLKPDLVTSGRSVVSLRAPGSFIANNYPSSWVGANNFVGSGTSFSAAVASGALALLLAAHPGYVPNTVKAALLATTDPGPVGNPFVDGHGALDVGAAVAEGAVGISQVPQSGPTATVGATAMGATVSLPATWNPSSWNPSEWSGVTWTPGTVAGPAVTGTAWNGTAWNGTAWNGTAWNGTAWNGTAWNGTAWNGTAWDGTAWNGTAWNGAAWNGTAWNGSSWT
jgi:serine protease AprX